jgi:Rrf2 family cysteine metabolism transcriptional repressor
VRVSTRTRYAVRAMLELALNKSNAPVQLKNIASRQDISVKYLEQLMATLKTAGFVRSVRGSKGGYILTRAPNQIKLDHIFNCLEGPVTIVECVGNDNFCSRAADCASRLLWAQLQAAMMCVLKSTTLQDLVDKTQTYANADYQI